jgi:CRP-like cAMP-binding protein
MALFDGETRSASVVAMTDTEVLALDQRRFNSLIHQLPDISIQVCKVLARRLRQANG